MVLSKTLTLIGFQACGKTTLGKILAHRFNCSFIDTDQLIEHGHPSLSCREIFQTFGAAYFRHCESQAIISLKFQPAVVLAVGGGSLLDSTNAHILKRETFLIYLKTSAEILKQRIRQQPTLPAYFHLNHSHQAFIQLYQERCSIYEQWADARIEMDDLSQEEAMQQLIRITQTIKE